MFKSLCDYCSKGFPTWKDMDQPRACDNCGLLYFSTRPPSQPLSIRSPSSPLPPSQPSPIYLNRPLPPDTHIRPPLPETHIDLNHPPPPEKSVTSAFSTYRPPPPKTHIDLNHPPPPNKWRLKSTRLVKLVHKNRLLKFVISIPH